MALETGIVGAGIVATNNHLPAVSRNPRTTLAAVCDVDANSATEAANEYGARSYTDVERMLSEESLDWVHVATPVQTHHAIGRQLLEAGVPTLLQKPATVTEAELTDLTDLANERGVPLSVVHNWLYYPVVREVRRRVAAGAIGPVRAVHTTVAGEGPPDETYRGDWVFDLPGGSLEEGMPHPLYLTLALGGYPRSESAIDAQTQRTGEYEGDIEYDGVQLQYESDDGALCSVTFLSDSARGTAVRIMGADGAITVDVPSMTIDERDAGAGPYHFWSERFDRNVAVTRNTVEGLVRNLRRYGREYLEDEFGLHLTESPDGHYYLIDRAAKAIEAGEQPPREPEESYWTLTLVERAREAARNERSD